MYSSLKVEAKNLKRTNWEQSCLRSKSRSVIEGRALITADIKSLRPLGKPLREEQIFWKLEDVHFSCLASNLSWLLYDTRSIQKLLSNYKSCVCEGLTCKQLIPYMKANMTNDIIRTLLLVSLDAVRLFWANILLKRGDEKAAVGSCFENTNETFFRS